MAKEKAVTTKETAFSFIISKKQRHSAAFFVLTKSKLNYMSTSLS